MEVKSAPAFVAIEGSATDTDADAVKVLFRSEDGDHYAISLKVETIPALITTIAGHANELLASRDDPPVQPLPVRALAVAMGPDGSVGLTIQSPSDLKTVFSFSREMLPALRSLLAELEELVGRDLQ